jgi:hypothetical protein
MTMAAAGAMGHRHSTNGGIQWLQVKPWMCSIGQCALHCIATSAWQSNLPAISMLDLGNSSKKVVERSHNISQFVFVDQIKREE